MSPKEQGSNQLLDELDALLATDDSSQQADDDVEEATEAAFEPAAGTEPAQAAQPAAQAQGNSHGEVTLAVPAGDEETPYAAPQGALPTVSVADEPPPTGKARVLVVDDNKDYREVVHYILERNGYDVVTASNGAEALEQVSRVKPDLMILDFNMPDKNGYEVLQEVRANFDTRKTRVMMFTGAPNRKALKEMGMDVQDFLEKPISNGALLAAVRRLLEGVPGGNGGSEAAEVAHDAPKPVETPAELAPEPIEVEPSPEIAAIASPEISLGIDEMAAEPAPESPTETEDGEDSDDMPSLEALENRDLEETEGLMVDVEKEEDDAGEEQGIEVMANDSPLVNRVNKIIVRAVDMGASDIHIEPQEKHLKVRGRVDGSLAEICTLPSSLTSRVAARIKIMSDLVITERRLPQDGQFRAAIGGRKIEFRVSTVPGMHGEKIVLRILGGAKVKPNMEELGFSTRDAHYGQRALQNSHGLVLVTGPTGSGKTTTLYTMIGTINKPDVNVMTVEDPVEYRLPGITQVHVKPGIGLTFDSVLRSFLRQDPDIMLVGEIRDLETAEIAVKASITGHLVLSTLHTNSAPATITRLTHMGTPPFLLAASIKLIVAQRLVRLLCPQCKVPAPLTEDDRKLLTNDESDRLQDMRRGVGCRRCHQTGFLGRKPIFEVMPLRTAEMRQLIMSSAGTDEVSALAVKEGMVPLREAALDMVAKGETSLQEALKIILAE